MIGYHDVLLGRNTYVIFIIVWVHFIIATLQFDENNGRM